MAVIKPSQYAPDTQEYAREQIKGEVVSVPRATLERRFSIGKKWFSKGKKFLVSELRNNRLAYARPDKVHAAQWLSEVFPEAVSRILAGEVFTIDSFQKLDYFHYLAAKLNPVCHKPGYNFDRAIRHIWNNKFCDLVRLVKNIKTDGMKAPLDMFISNGHPVLTRGYRRVEILYQLGYKYTTARVWRTEWLVRRFLPTAKWDEFYRDGVHGAAIAQFLKYGHRATDKYYKHGYTPFYDFHMRGRHDESLKILELGVNQGMSLDIWHKAFPRSKIFGIDKEPKKQWGRLVNKDRIKTFDIDLSDKKAMMLFAKKYGPFDLIIDDASHRPGAMIRSYQMLWKHLNHNGIYAVEDLHNNYRSVYEKDSAMPFFKNLVDTIYTNHRSITVAFYPNIVFIEKA